MGIWVFNVKYGVDDVYFYEYDIYFGYVGEVGDILYDVGYLYYNYDIEVGYDFGEIYGIVGYGNFSVILYVLVNVELDEGLN